jgi:hypothetical protein
MKTTIITVLAALAFAVNAQAYPIEANCAHSSLSPHGVWDCR